MISKVVDTVLSVWARVEIKAKGRSLWLGWLGANLIFLHSALAQVWTQSSAPSKSWYRIASSGDGNVLVAVTGTSIYVSTNAGSTWRLTTAPAKNWSALAASDNGKMLLAVNELSGVYTSTNFGGTWVSNSVPGQPDWVAAAVSANGNTLMVGGQVFGPVYYSTNAGVNWRSNGIPTGYWTGVACSGDGTKLAALWNGVIYTSTNSGGIWVSNTATGSTVLFGSANGQYLIRQNGQALTISPDWGVSWFTTYLPANSPVVGISADGSRLVTAYNGVTAISTNQGTNWTTFYGPAKVWRAGAASADATRIAAVTTSTDGIYLWTPPVLTVTNVAGASFDVQWSTNGTLFNLQMNSDLTTSNWVTVPDAPLATNSVDRVTVVATNGGAYFRLMEQ